MFNIQKIESTFNANKHIGILVLRIFVGGRLLYGVIDNIISWDRMIEFANFLEANAFPIPVASAVVSVYVQFFGAILLLVGYKTRLVAVLLMLNFIIAILFVHFRANDTVEDMTPALAMLFGCLTLLFTGAEKTSFDHYSESK